MTENSIEKSKLFFPNLDGLRFFCFLPVFLFHCNGTLLREIHDKDIKAIVNFLFQNGNIGVNIFFVLSGFLITFLLIKEKEITRNISLRNFYIRRILRIWPLYYLCVFLGFVVFPFLKYKIAPGAQEIPNVWYYIFFTANFDLIKLWPNGVHDALTLSLIVLWSVAIEEQFYLTWPVILKYSVSKFYPLIFSGIIVSALLFRFCYTDNTLADYSMRNFHTFSVIGDMATGGLMAYYCSYNSALFRYIRNVQRWQIILLYSLTISLLLFKNYVFYYSFSLPAERLIFALLFASIIAEQNYAQHSFFKFSMFKTISKLGTYTYGLYCLHFIAILSVGMILEKYDWKADTFWAASTASLAALAITIGISLLSYHFFEKYFLQLKNRFAFIVKK